jgi:penicillin amidase
MNVANVARRVGVVAGVATGIGGAALAAALYRPLPRTSGSLRLDGLHERVEIVRDRWGVPHIYASNNDDLFFAQGFVHAQERLWQMELNRRTAHGELAELFGEQALASDRFVRVLGFSRVARREAALLDAMTRPVVDAYVRGVNAFLEHPRTVLPLEFRLLRHHPRPWQPADVLVWSKVMALSLSADWKAKLLHAHLVARLGETRTRALMMDDDDYTPIVLPDTVRYRDDMGAGALQSAARAAPFLQSEGGPQGSNGWVVGGERTASGKPLLANDTHLNLALPSVWYEAHLEGGDYRVTGATFPGLPGVLVGHNERIAWGVTNGLIDVQDLYIEHFHPEDPLRYAWKSEWETAELVREEIRVRGRATPVVEEVRITRHGPVISAIAAPHDSPLAPDEHLAFRWTALEPSNALRAALKLNRATGWADFRDALRDWDTPPQNFVYADVEGNHGYALSGNVPIRAQGNMRVPVPGWDGAYEWEGYVPAEEMPAAYNPPEGMLVTANNRMTSHDYPHRAAVRGDWLNGYRAARILEMLHARQHHDVQGFATMQQDQRSLPGLQLARLLADLELHAPLAVQARDIIQHWDGNLTPQSVGGTIYTTVRYYLYRTVYAEGAEVWRAGLGSGLFTTLAVHYYDFRGLQRILAHIEEAHRSGTLHTATDAWLGNNRTWGAVLQQAFSLAIEELRQRLGDDPTTWRYGRLHRLTLRHALGRVAALAPILNRGPWETGGDMDTVSMGYLPHDAAAMPFYIAPSCRQIFDTSNWDACISVLAGGQSGHPASRHYCDMARLWRAGDYHPMAWSREHVQQYQAACLLLEPASHAENR